MKTLTIILSFLTVQSTAQDLTGQWKGYLETPGSKLEYEMTISENGKKMRGYSLTVYVKDGVENVGVKKVLIRQRKDYLFMDDGDLIYDNFTMKPMRVKLSSSLRLSTPDSQMVLSGTFKTRSLDMRDESSYSGKIFLKKQGAFSTTRLIAQLDEMNLVQDLSFLPTNIKTRLKQEEKTANIPVPVTTLTEDLSKPDSQSVTATPTVTMEIIREISFSSDSLLLSLVDNGTVDGDTVSLVLNNRTILKDVALKTAPVRIKIPVPANAGDSLLLVMVAENLGALPPNTGLLTIMDGETRYDIRFEGDLQRSSAIVLRKK